VGGWVDLDMVDYLPLILFALYLWLSKKVYDTAFVRAQNPYLWTAVGILITPIIAIIILVAFFPKIHE